MDVSIILPTKNGGKTIENCLNAVQTQKTSKTFEIIAIDSGSSDNTVEILKKHNCKIIEISPLEFTHGYSRNLGAENANGSVLIFMNQDAIPQNDSWMEELISEIDNTNVATFSRQIPYANTPIVEKVFLSHVYPDKSRTIGKEVLSKRDLSNSILFSTVSSAIKRDIVLQFKFANDIIMAEDQELAVRLIRAGYTIKYVSESKVFHSHSYSVPTVFKRYFDVGWGLNSISDLEGLDPSKIICDEMKLLKESLLVSMKNPAECLFALFYTIAKSMGFALGTKADSLPESLRKFLSHTISLKHK
jgi:rhamnosyltransferase